MIDLLLAKAYPTSSKLPGIYVVNDHTISDMRWGRSPGSLPGSLIGTIPKFYSQMEQLTTVENYNRIDIIFDKMCNNAECYNANFKPHKETILLYGPPGTVKTSIIRHMASKYDLDIFLVDPQVLFGLPDIASDKPTIYLIEDIESYGYLLEGAEIELREKKPPRNFGERNQFSNFINALDGVKTLDNKIIVMTANYPELLKPSLTRKGRVDHRILMDYLPIQRILELLKWESTDPRYTYLKENREDGSIPIAVFNELTNTQTVDDVRYILSIEDDKSHRDIYTK